MIYALYHSTGETVGLIGDVLKELKLPFKDVHLHDGEGLPRETSDLDGLIVMGGSMNVDDVVKFPFLMQEAQLIERVLADKKPVLGICLGAQLMAKALGERVFQNHKKEVGWHPVHMTPAAKNDPLFKSFPPSITVLQWHGDTFNVPRGGVHLARTPDCDAQAFRWGDNAYALQFHLEVTAPMVKNWCAADCEQSFIREAGEDPRLVAAETLQAQSQIEPLATMFFSSYFKMAYSRLLAPV